MSGDHEHNPGEFSSPASDKIGLLRIIDAEANRAAEGLRVVEDYVRFVLDDSHLTGVAKQLRHDLTAALHSFSMAERLAARESQADVGVELSTQVETQRGSLTDVAAASFQRLTQALRSLEEYGKLLDPLAAGQIEKIRFRAYTLQRAASITADSQARLAAARLYVLLDGGADEEAFARLAQSVVEAGVHVLQLRDKQLADRELLSRARRLREICRGTSTLFIMNDRADVAVLSAADGVHVGQDELSVKDARAIVGPRALVGVSTHNIEQARRAVLDGANYLGVGPTFPSTTKSFAAFAGLDFVRAVATEISLPAFAIGGITLENVSQVLSSGLQRVAVSGAVVDAADQRAAVQKMLQQLAMSQR